MNPILQREIINFLRPLPQFQNESGRTALLTTAGLSHLISSLDLRGSADEFVPLLVRRLDAFGVLSDDEPALAVLLRSLAGTLGQDKQATLREFCLRLLEETPASAFASCPYRGLSAFREDDEQYFFGRDSYTRKLVDLVQANPFVAVLGASGSGKSSLVYAGLIPQLRRQLPSSEGLGVGKWHIITFRPGEHPLHALSKALIPCLYSDELEQIGKIKQLTAQLRSGEIGVKDVIDRIVEKAGSAVRLLLFVDQFEEVYALCDDLEERQRFLDELLSVCGSTPLTMTGHPERSRRVVITLRSDFLDQTNRHPDFSHLIAEHNLLVPAMNADELRAAIAEPAKKAGQPLSGEVVDLLIEQTKEREGVLPLLEFALTQIWDGMARGVEPADTLKQIGGVGGALANKAKELFSALSDTEQQIARRAFLAMTRLGEGTKDTRRRAALADMVSHQNAPDDVRNVLRVFAQPGARLLTLAEDAAEITHEALFEHWDALKAWIDANRDDLRFLRQVSDAAQAWDAQGRPDGSLWRSPNLDLLKTFHARTADDMTVLQVAFFQESERKEKQARFRKRMTWAGLIALTVLSLIAAMWAIRSERIAQKERQKAEFNEIETLNQTSKALFASHDELNALLKAIKAGKKINTTKSVPVTLSYRIQFNLKDILSNIRQKNRFESISGILSPDGKVLASISTDDFDQPIIKLSNIDDLKRITILRGFSERLREDQIVFSPDSKILALLTGRTIKIWSVPDGTERKTFSLLNEMNDVIFNSDGTILALTNGETIELWDIAEGKLLRIFPKPKATNNSSIDSILFSPDNQLLALKSSDGIQIINSENGREISNLQAINDTRFTSMVFSPDGRIVVLGSENGNVTLWDLISKEVKTWRNHSNEIKDIMFRSHGTEVISSDDDGNIKIAEFTTGKELQLLKGNLSIEKMWLSKDEKQLITDSRDEYKGLYKFELWDITDLMNRKTDFNIKFLKLGEVLIDDYMQFTSDGTKLVFSERYSNWNQESKRYEGNTVIIWDIKDNKAMMQIREPFLRYNYVALRSDILICIFYDSDVSESILLIHNMKDNKQTRTILKNISPPFAVSPDGKILAPAVLNNFNLKLYSIQDGKELFILQGHLDRVKSLAFNLQGSILASGGTDKMIKIWNVMNGREMLTIPKKVNAVTSLVFSSDNMMLASGSKNIIKFWDVKNWNEIGILQESQFFVEEIAFSKNRNILLSHTGFEIKLWDIENKDKVATLLYTNPSGSYSKPCFSADGKIIAIGRSFPGHTDVILYSLDFLNETLVHGCKWLKDYLKNPYANLSDEDRVVCDDILSSTK